MDRHCQLLDHWTVWASQVVKGICSPLSRWGGDVGLSLGSVQGIQTSFHLVIWKMSLHLSLCREIRPSFESGHLGVHSIWGRKHRVPLTYLLLREGSSWGACGKLAYLFSGRQGMVLILRRYGLHSNFSKLLYWNWWSSILERVVSINLWSFLKEVKPHVLYDVDHRMVMERMQWKFASSQFDLGYTRYFEFL